MWCYQNMSGEHSYSSLYYINVSVSQRELYHNIVAVKYTKSISVINPDFV